VTDKSAVKSGEKLARTICFLTPLALVRYGHNFVKRDGQIRRKIGRKTSPDNMLFDPPSKYNANAINDTLHLFECKVGSVSRRDISIYVLIFW
jgi:hypothetical protein